MSGLNLRCRNSVTGIGKAGACRISSEPGPANPRLPVTPSRIFRRVHASEII
jgi:hypothetical protein